MDGHFGERHGLHGADSRMSPIVTATLRDGSTLSASYADSTALPVWPESKITPAAGENVNAALKRAAKGSRAVLPAGSFPLIGNGDTNFMSLYSDIYYAIKGAGVDVTNIEMVKNSWQTKSASKLGPGLNGAAAVRFGPNGGKGGVARSMSDLTMRGRDQVGPDGVTPMFRQGFQSYYGNGDVYARLRFVGMSRAGGNSPNTGETMSVAGLHDLNVTWEDLEVDGRDPDTGLMVGGSALGLSGCTNTTVRRAYLHHSQYSGFTVSVAGSDVKTATQSNGFYGEDIRVEMNANHPGVGTGGRFAGANFEQFAGLGKLVRFDVMLDQYGLHDSRHFAHGGVRGDNSTPFQIIDPQWHGKSPTWANGAFVAMIYGDQKTAPIVTVNGATLKPVVVPGTPPSSPVSIDPKTQFALVVDSSYVAP